MPSRTLRASLVLLVAATLAACQAHPAAMGPAAAPPGAPAPQAPAFGPQEQGVILRGRVHWSTMRRLMATATEVGASATVTLYNAANAPVAAGLADADGDFTLYEGTVPLVTSTGDLYTLEVSRRVPSDTQQSLLSLRTVVRNEGAGVWTSITGRTIVISALTTAIAQLEADNAATSLADVIETVDGATVTPFGGFELGAITARETQITADLTANTDPNRIVPVHFVGNVTIEDPADLALAQRIGSIEGDLTIRYTGGVAVALPRLKTVSGLLWIDSLVVGGQSATALPTVPLLTSIGGLTISGGAFTSLAGLASLTKILGTLTLTDVNALTTLTGLDNVTTIDGAIRIQRASALTDLSALSNLATLTYGFELEDLTATGLTSFGNFASLTAIADGGLALTNLPHVTSLDGLSKLKSLGSISINHMEALTSLGGLPDPVIQPGHTVAIANAGITSLAGLGGFSGAGLELSADACPALASLSGLGEVTSFDNLMLRGTSVASFAELPATLSVIERFELSDSAGVGGANGPVSLTGLEDITIQSSFTIMNLPTITSIAAPVFPAAMDEFIVENCPQITTLASPNLAAIKGLGYRLYLVDLPGLTHIDFAGLVSHADPDFDSISYATDIAGLRIVDCPLLPYCEGYALFIRRAYGAHGDFPYDANIACQ